MGLLDGEIRKAIADGFRGKLLKGTLTKINTTGRNNTNGDPITASVTYHVQGYIENYDEIIRVKAGIPSTDSKVVLIAGLCGARPAIGDHVMFTSGEYAGQSWQVRDVASDPAGATYEAQSFVSGLGS